MSRAEKRAEVCRECDQARSVTLTRHGWPVYQVDCARCGCGGLSLTSGQCPLGKWPAEAGE